jgi:hypothetical protein
VRPKQQAVTPQVFEKQQRADSLVTIRKRVIFDDEVQQMRRANLNGRIKRLAVKGLLDGAKNAV